MIVAFLFRTNKVGSIVRLASVPEGFVPLANEPMPAFRIVRETGLSCDCLPGGTGVRQVELIPVYEKKGGDPC
jgi:hypothetical protein